MSNTGTVRSVLSVSVGSAVEEGNGRCGAACNGFLFVDDGLVPIIGWLCCGGGDRREEGEGVRMW